MNGCHKTVTDRSISAAVGFVIGELGFIYHLSYSKVKARDSTNFYNQTFNSRAAVFDS